MSIWYYVKAEFITLSVAFQIISFAFVNQELCRVLCDEAKSHLCHFFVFIEKSS